MRSAIVAADASAITATLVAVVSAIGCTLYTVNCCSDFTNMSQLQPQRTSTLRVSLISHIQCQMSSDTVYVNKLNACWNNAYRKLFLQLNV